MSYLSTLRNSVNLFLSNPTWDILLLLFFFAAVFLYGLIVGRNRIIMLLLASYPAALINEYFPYPANFLARFNISQTVFLKSFSFFILTLVIFWVLKKSGISRKELNKKTTQVIFLSFLNVGFWANVVFGYVINLNANAIKLAPLTHLLFGSSAAHFAWLVLPIAVLFYLEKK